VLSAYVKNKFPTEKDFRQDIPAKQCSRSAIMQFLEIEGQRIKKKPTTEVKGISVKAKNLKNEN